MVPLKKAPTPVLPLPSLKKVTKIEEKPKEADLLHMKIKPGESLKEYYLRILEACKKNV